MTEPLASAPIQIWLRDGTHDVITAGSFVRDRFSPDEIVVTDTDGHVVVVPRDNIANIVFTTIEAADEYFD